MIVCPNCRQEAMEGAFFCDECGTRLVPQSGFSTQNIQRSPETSALDSVFIDTAIPKTQPQVPAVASISLHMLNYGKIVPLEGREEFTIGRETKGQPVVPDVDLTPYDAYQAGVSRLHAAIKIDRGQVSLVDLGSVNGTSINEVRIPPNVYRLLKHGDMIALGRLKIQILIRK